MNVYFHTFGCKANQYDTELVRQAFADQGAVLVDDPAAADLAVVNSCTVTAESETKLRRFVRGLARRGAKLETVVMGCAAALDEGRIAGLPSVRAVVAGADPGVVLAAAGMAHARPDPVLRRFHANARGWLKIQDGCDEHCTFCATTIARGANRSRPVAELVQEAQALSAHHAEIVLTGVHIGTYGLDRSSGWTDPGAVPRGSPRPASGSAAPGAVPRGSPRPGSGAADPGAVPRGSPRPGSGAADPGAVPRGSPRPASGSAAPGAVPRGSPRPGSGSSAPGAVPRGFEGQGVAPGNPGAWPRGRSTLGELLEALIAAVPQVRFRLSSIEATEVDDRIARLLIEAPQSLAAHLHAPLQSGSNRVLKRMGRHWYTAESYRGRLEWLAARLPVFGLGADVIAGFPGETDADHRATLALLEALPFTYLHVFPFSVRPDAAAARLSDECSPAVVHGRARELRELGEAKARAHLESRVGQRADGVVSGHGAGQIEMLTQDYLSVYLPTAEWDGCPRCEVTVR